MASPRAVRVGLGGLVLLVAFGGGAAVAGEVKHVGLILTVTHVSQTPGSIDPKAPDLHQRLQAELRYGSLRVLERKRLDLAMDETGGVRLPTGRWVRVRPLHVGERGVLLAVDIEGGPQMDLRIPKRHPVDIGAQRYQDGKLIVTLERDD